jgi:hypothetical protein
MGKKKFHAASSLLLAASSCAGEVTRSKYNAATKNELQQGPAGAGGNLNSVNMAFLTIPAAIQNEYRQKTATRPAAPIQDRNNASCTEPRAAPAALPGRRRGCAIRGKYELTSADRSFV